MHIQVIDRYGVQVYANEKRNNGTGVRSFAGPARVFEWQITCRLVDWMVDQQQGYLPVGWLDGWLSAWQVGRLKGFRLFSGSFVVFHQPRLAKFLFVTFSESFI